MPYTTLITADELAQHLDDPNWAVVDCRFSFADTELGRREYRQAHIPGAVYAHLDNDLCGPIVPGETGRHPLPDPAVLARTLGGWGIGPGVQVVAYDVPANGTAARLWWQLRWLGHDQVAVLDGGWPAWQAQGRPVRAGEETRPPREFVPALRADWVVSAEAVEEWRTDPGALVVDSRSRERYRGEIEPIDPVAGHIPGAVCAPYMATMDQDGHFHSPAALKAHFEAVLNDLPAEQAVFYCGSGVSAAVNLLALARAGLGDARLYAGSWSEWIIDPRRPVALGEEP